jgi:hypothetical protein
MRFINVSGLKAYLTTNSKGGTKHEKSITDRFIACSGSSLRTNNHAGKTVTRQAHQLCDR